MAGQRLPFFVTIGPSNQNGAGSNLSALSGTNLARVIGLPAFPSTTPALVTVPGIKLWTAKMPFAANSVRNIQDVPSTTTVEFDGTAIGATDVGRWVYIASNTTGEGQSRRISAQGGNSLTVPTAWSPTLSADGTMRIITGSHSVSAQSVLVAAGIADAGGSTTTMVDAARTEADGAWTGLTIRFTSGANNGLTREILNFVAATDTMTFAAVTAVVGAGDTYDILGIAPVVAGVADAGGSTSTMVDAALGELDDAWNGLTIQFTNGTNNGLKREIVDFIDSTNTVIFHPAVPAAVANTDTYNILQSTKVIVKDSTSGSFPGADVGRWVSVSGQFRKITAIATVGTTQAITLDNALLVAAAANDPIYVLDGSASCCDTMANFASGAAWKDLQFFIDTAPVFFTGYDYCNYTQNAPAAPYSTAATTLVNSVPELFTQLRYRFQDTIYGFELGVDSAQAASQYVGTSLQIVTFAWKHDMTHLDYHPSNTTGGLIAAVLAGITSAQALAAGTGDTLDPQGIFFVGLLENDTLDVQKLAHLGDNVAMIRDKIRTALGNQRIPCVILGCSPSSLSTADRDNANAQALQLKLDDVATGFVTTPQTAFVKVSDQIHYTPDGHVAIAQALATEWDAIKSRINDAARLQAELPTLATLRTKVRRRYERTASGNDASTGQMDQFINDAISELCLTLGDDKAWFMRRIEQVDISAGIFPNTINLPRTVKRLLRIEVAACPGQPLTWKGIGYTDEGRLQVTLHSVVTGPFNVHFIALQRPLVVDTDVAIVPDEYVELVVVLACKRLTECAGNAAMLQYYAAESQRLWREVKRSCQLHDRQRQPQMEMIGGYDSWINGAWPGGDEWGL